mgnify:CR=1 FL=1
MALRIALRRQAVDDRPAGIRQPHHLGALVESLARRIVYRGAHDFHLKRSRHLYDLGMPSRYEQTQERKRRMRNRLARNIDEMRQNMPLQMIDLHERYIICNGQSFGERHSDEQGAEQAGPPGKGDGIEVGDTDRRVFKRRIHHGNDVLLMGTRGEFGNHAAVLHMHRLRGDDVGKHFGTAQHGCRGIVARRLDAENHGTGAG